MGLFNSRSAAKSCWLLMSLALQLLLVQAQRNRYAPRGYRGRRIGQPRPKVEAPLPHFPLPVPIRLLGGGARLMFPPPPKEFAHANFLPNSEPVDYASGVIKIKFSKDEVDTSSAVEENPLDQEKKIIHIQPTTTTTTATNNEPNSHFVVLPDIILPLETDPPSNIPKALTSNSGQLLDVDVRSNFIPELTTFAFDDELLTVMQKEIASPTSEASKNIEINTITSNVLDISPKINIIVESEAQNNSEVQVNKLLISATVDSEPSSDLANINKADPIDSNALEILPLFTESHDSGHQELLRLSSTESELESDNNPNNVFEEIEEVKNLQSFKITDPLPSITLIPILSSQSSIEDNDLASITENIDTPVTDTLVQEFNEIIEQDSTTTESSKKFTTIEPQPFKRSNQPNKYQPIWVIHDFDSTNKASSKQSLSSVSHRTWRNPTWL